MSTPTRLYFASNRTADIAVDDGALWDADSHEPPKQLSRSKLGSPAQTFSMSFSTGQMAKQIVFVSPPLRSQTISGTVKCQVAATESNADDNCRGLLEIYLVKSTGQFRATLLTMGQHGPATEYHTSLRNKSLADGDILQNTPVLDGDRIVVVLGHTDNSGTTPNGSFEILDISGADDFPEDETDTATKVPWIEFSGELQFADDTTDTDTVITDPGTGITIPNPETTPSGLPTDIDEPRIPPPPPWYQIGLPLDNPPNQQPAEGIEEYIYLVKVEGDPNAGFVFRDHRILSLEYRSLDWWYHRTGGLGTFRLLTKEQQIIADVSDDRPWQWELHVRIRLPGELNTRTWYRGIINKATAEVSGQELLTDVQGIGYSGLLNRIWVSRRYPPLTPVSTILADLLDNYILPNTTIRRAEVEDVTAGGIDDPQYIMRGSLTLECSVFKALKIIAELEGNIEWGVDAARNFYWRRENEAFGFGFNLDQDTVYIRGGHYSAERINKVRVDASPMGSMEYQLTRGDITDVTDITSKGEHNIVAEAPWFNHPSDAAHWADNIIITRRRLLHWRVVGWNEVTDRLEQNHPLSGLPIIYWRDGNDVTTGFSHYQLAKIHYIKGGKSLTEIREKGRTSVNKFGMPAQLKAEVYLGNPPKDYGETIEAMSDQVESLKSRNKLRRYPRDVTDIANPKALLDVTGMMPGEIIHYRKDVTNNDLPNDEDELQDVTNPRAILASWLSKQWTKISIRRTFRFLPNRGLFIGEMVALYTDITNEDEGTLYWWDGYNWNQIGTGSSSSSNSGAILEFGGLGGDATESMVPWARETITPVAVDAFGARVEMPRAGILRNLRVRIVGTVAVSNIVWTVRVNGVDTALSVAITPGNSVGSDTTNSVTVSVGDLVEVTIVGSTAQRASKAVVEFA